MAETDGFTGLPPNTAAAPDRYQETLRLGMLVRQAIAAGFPDAIRDGTSKLFHFVLDNFDGSGVTAEDLRPYLPPNACRQVLAAGVLEQVKEGAVPVAVMREVVGNFKIGADRLDGPAINRLSGIYFDRIMQAEKLNRREDTLETLLALARRKPDEEHGDGDDRA